MIGHNFLGFDLDVLLHRMSPSGCNVANWSLLGRLRRRNMPKLQSGAGGLGDSTWEEKQVTAGRLVCDTYLSAKVMIPHVDVTHSRNSFEVRRAMDFLV